MIIAIIILALVLILVTTKYVIYRRQIADICRQLSFIISNDTNVGVTSYVDAKEILKLEKLINELNDSTKNERALYKRKDRQLKEALANVSHDIRTPLTSLKGYFQLLRNEEDLDKQIQYASIIKERMDNLTELLDELFTYTRLQNDDYEIELSECNLTKPILETMFSFFDVIKEQKIDPELDVYEGDVLIKGNELAIKRSISNIIRNSLFHGNGKLKIKYSLVDRGFSESADINDKAKHFVAFECSNSVENPEDIDITQVFERFYKADKTRNKISTGLGLAIAKTSVEMMGGTIEARLEEDMFSICICFPVIG